MGYTTHTPQSWNDLANLLHALHPQAPWGARGEGSEFADVLCSLDRHSRHLKLDTEQWLRLESILHTRFIQNAAMHLSPVEIRYLGIDHAPVVPGEQLLTRSVIMRHYGAPTRLVDWSGSVWIAAYMACASARPEELGNARIMAFDRHAFNNGMASMMGAECDAWQSDMLDFRLADQLKNWINTFYTMDWPRFPRYAAQQGSFTFAGKPRVDHWKALCNLWAEASLPASSLVYIKIPLSITRDVLRNLAAMGIAGHSMYPGTEGVCKSLGSV